MRLIGKLYHTIKTQLSSQSSFDLNAVISPLLQVHEPSFSSYANVLRSLQRALSYLRSETFQQREQLFRALSETEYLRPLCERPFEGLGTEVFLASYALVRARRNQQFFDYLNGSLLLLSAQQPQNADCTALLLAAVDLKLRSNALFIESSTAGYQPADQNSSAYAVYSAFGVIYPAGVETQGYEPCQETTEACRDVSFANRDAAAGEHANAVDSLNTASGKSLGTKQATLEQRAFKYVACGPLTVPRALLSLFVRHSYGSQNVQIILLNNAFLFDAGEVIVQLSAIFRAEIANLVEQNVDFEKSFLRVFSALNLLAKYESNALKLGEYVKANLIQPIGKLIRQTCMQDNTFTSYELASRLFSLAAEVVHALAAPPDRRSPAAFAAVCEEVFAQCYLAVADAEGEAEHTLPENEPASGSVALFEEKDIKNALYDDGKTDSKNQDASYEIAAYQPARDGSAERHEDAKCVAGMPKTQTDYSEHASGRTQQGMTYFQEVLLFALQTQFDGEQPILDQLRLKNAALQVLIQVLSGAHNRTGVLASYSDLLVAEAVFGVTVRHPCRTFKLQADQLTTPGLQRIARVAASIPVERQIAPARTCNAHVHYAVQCFIYVLDVLYYNDYCGDDCAYTRDATGKSYKFEIADQAVVQLLHFFANYRLFSAHLLLVNPHFKDQMQQVDELARLAIAKMAPHAAMLKANAAGFFEKVDFVRAFEQIMDLMEALQLEKSAIFTGFLLGRIKSADPAWQDLAGQKADLQIERIIAYDRGIIQPEEAGDLEPEDTRMQQNAAENDYH